MATTSAGNAQINPAWIEAWLAGWALARACPALVRFPGGLRVDTGTAEERVRYLLFGADTGAIAAIIAAEPLPGAVIKVCAATSALAPHLPASWKLHGPQHLMIASLAGNPSAQPLAAGYSVALQAGAPLGHVRIHDHTGAIAASGRLVLIGSYGIVDEIYTEPEHRRRGLGSHLVAELMRMGGIAGARTGLLVATASGYGLYSKLGWAIHTPYSSAYNV